MVLNIVVIIMTIAVTLCTGGVLWTAIFGRPFVKKKPNPEIEKLETVIKLKKISLIKGSFRGESIWINNKKKFLDYAKKNSVKTIFKQVYPAFNDIDYFYNIQGKVVKTSLRKRVKR